MRKLIEELLGYTKGFRVLTDRFLDTFYYIPCVKKAVSYVSLSDADLKEVAWTIGFEGEPITVLKQFEGLFRERSGLPGSLSGRQEREVTRTARQESVKPLVKG